MNNAPFKIGQEVVCVKVFNWNYALKVGETYTVKSVKKCCGKWIVSVAATLSVTCCSKCENVLGVGFMNAMCFAPISYSSATKELIESIQIGDYQDVPVKKEVVV